MNQYSIENTKKKQDNRILAELEHPRTTGPSSHVTGITSSSILPSNLSYSTGVSTVTGSSGITSGIIGGINSMGISSSASSHALTTNYDGTISGIGNNSGGPGTVNISSTIGGANVSPLPVRAAATHQISSTMPPICQV